MADEQDQIDPEEILDDVEGDAPPEDPDEGSEEGDAPAEGEESEDAPDEGDEPAPVATAPRKKQSANGRIRQLNADLQREREARNIAEARTAARQEIEQGRSAAAQAAADVEEARLVNAMTLEEKAIYSVAKQQKVDGDRFARLERQLFDSNDRSAFTAKYANDPRFSKFLDDVETRTRQMHAQGVPIQREAVLKFLIGERAMSAPAKKAGTQQRQQATTRRAAAQGNTRGGRSDTGRQSSRSGSLAQRMEQENGAV